jgi:hypothetical protein
MLKQNLETTVDAATHHANTVGARSRHTPFVRLALLTAGAVAIHGYHVGVEDGEIYVPAARKLLDHSLYPFATEFFLSHGRLSLFSPILAWTARLTHLSMDWTMLLWYVVSIYLLLAACWKLAATCFTSPRARWCALLVVTAVLTMPATNTGLLLIDPYLTSRSLSTPLTVVALTLFLERRYALAWLAVLATASLHPQMAAFLVFLMVVLWSASRYRASTRRHAPALTALLGVWPFGLRFEPAQGPYREALYARDYFFLSNWTWYHWLGMVAPLLFLAWFSWGQLRGTTPAFRQLSFALVPFGLVSILAGALFSSSHSFDILARLQPMRCFHLITLVFVLLFGGVIGEYAAKGRTWVLAAISAPLACGMYVVACQTYPNSAHIDWPWVQTSPNAWLNTLLWVRDNTPKNAVFAVDSRYFKDPGVDERGFRAVSERSALADYYKDGGVAAMFPHLADEWKQMSDATYGLNHFKAEDFDRLSRQYPVTWAVIHGPAPTTMDCPYQQHGYTVCRIEPTHSGM